MSCNKTLLDAVRVLCGGKPYVRIPCNGRPCVRRPSKAATKVPMFVGTDVVPTYESIYKST